MTMARRDAMSWSGSNVALRRSTRSTVINLPSLGPKCTEPNNHIDHFIRTRRRGPIAPVNRLKSEVPILFIWKRQEWSSTPPLRWRHRDHRPHCRRPKTGIPKHLGHGPLGHKATHHDCTLSRPIPNPRAPAPINGPASPSPARTILAPSV